MKFLKPVTGRISSRFGNRKHPITGKLSFHNGIDIAAPIGTPVIAPDSGKIIEYWDHVKGGKCIALFNGSVRFGFAHLNKRLVTLNQLVNKGDVIAEVGNTGASTGAHLHFTVKVNGVWVNPEVYI